ncbi:MAG: nitrite/sulfite reductase, partial [Pseudomonadota bacterium]
LYLEALMRVYNRYGRRDNKYKARIKILVNEIGLEAFAALVEKEYSDIQQHGGAGQTLSSDQWQRIKAYFEAPDFRENIDAHEHHNRLTTDNAYRQWCANNLSEHKAAQHHIVTVSLKATGAIPGDATAEQMRVVARLAQRYAYDEIRVSHEQNLILPHVPVDCLPGIYDALVTADLATANAGLISDIIACPGMDYCALATARSIPVAQEISQHFADTDQQSKIGKLSVKISGCINACGHHHVGNIGILGLEKGGRENYQFTLGGDPSDNMQLGQRAGPGVDADQVVPALQRVINVYLERRSNSDEAFIDTCNRVGTEPFKQAIYDHSDDTHTAAAG